MTDEELIKEMSFLEAKVIIGSATESEKNEYMKLKLSSQYRTIYIDSIKRMIEDGSRDNCRTDQVIINALKNHLERLENGTDSIV